MRLERGGAGARHPLDRVSRCSFGRSRAAGVSLRTRKNSSRLSRREMRLMRLASHCGRLAPLASFLAADGCGDDRGGVLALRQPALSHAAPLARRPRCGRCCRSFLCRRAPARRPARRRSRAARGARWQPGAAARRPRRARRRLAALEKVAPPYSALGSRTRSTSLRSASIATAATLAAPRCSSEGMSR